MKCERAIDVLTQSPNRIDPVEQRFATEHLNKCADCQDAIDALRVLHAERTIVVPQPPEGALERALLAAASQPQRAAPPRRMFWAGMSVGAALAAGIAIAVIGLAPGFRAVVPATTPAIELALNEPRDVSISLATAQALDDAEIHVILSGSIALRGFDGRKELRWRTNLDAGANQLTLPVIATGAEGGQVLVEVIHAQKRRTFVVDVRALG